MDLPRNVLLIHINTPQSFCSAGSETSASTYANMFQSSRTKVMLIPIHAIFLWTDPKLQGCVVIPHRFAFLTLNLQ